MHFYLRFLLLIVLSAFFAACSSTDVDDEEGPAELIEFKAERQFNKVWDSSVGNGQGGIYNRLIPAERNGTLVVAATSGDVESFDVLTGDNNWSVDVESFLVGGVGIGEDIVLVGTASGKVIALGLSDGQQKWVANVEGEVLSPPQTNGDLVFVQTYDGQLLALSVKDGSRVWSYRSTLPVLTLRGTSTPLIYRDSVIAGFSNGNVVSFDVATGTVLWTVKVALSKGNSEIDRIIDIDAPLLLSNKVIYAVAYQGKVAAIDPDSGRRIWANDASSHVGMSEGFSNVYVTGEDGSVTAYDKSGQGVRWAQTVLARRKLSGSITMGSYVVVADVEGYLHALSQVDGSLAARVQFDSDGVQTDLLKVDELLIVYGNDGDLAAYRLEEKRSGFSLFK